MNIESESPEAASTRASRQAGYFLIITTPTGPGGGKPAGSDASRTTNGAGFVVGDCAAAVDGGGGLAGTDGAGVPWKPQPASAADAREPIQKGCLMRII